MRKSLQEEPGKLAQGHELWVVIALIIIAQGVAVGLYLNFISNIQAGDFQAFYFATERALNGEPFVGQPPPTGVDTAWVFPPIIVVYFIPFTFVSWPTAFVLQNILNACFLGAVTWAITKYRTNHNGLGATMLFGAVVLLNPYAMQNFAQGQMNALVLMLLIAGMLAVERGSPSFGGFSLGLGALIKVWPAGLGLWLIWQHEWKAIGVAILTGVSGLLAGIVIFGLDTTLRWFGVLLYRGRLHRLGEGLKPDNTMISFTRPLAGIMPRLPTWIYLAMAILVVGIATVVVAFRYSPEGLPLAAGGFIILGTLLMLPASTFPYLIVPIVTGIVLLSDVTLQPRIRGLLATGLVLAAAPINIQDLIALAPTFEKLVVAPLDAIFMAFPPYLVGAILLWIGHGAVVADRST